MSKIQSWQTALLLSIVIPVGFFTAFRLTGTFHGPATITETMTAETIIWNMTRPVVDTTINRTIINTYSSDNIDITFDFQILAYYRNDSDYPAWNNDYIKIRIIGNANVFEGFVHSMKIVFSQTEEDALIRINEDFRTIELDDCKQNSAQILGSRGRAAYFEVYGVDQPESCRLGILVAWIFLDDNLADHNITAILETTYFDGANYRQVNIPIYSDVVA